MESDNSNATVKGRLALRLSRVTENPGCRLLVQKPTLLTNGDFGRLLWRCATKSRLQNITLRCLLSGTWPSICLTSAAGVVLRAIRKERQSIC